MVFGGKREILACQCKIKHSRFDWNQYFTQLTKMLIFLYCPTIQLQPGNFSRTELDMFRDLWRRESNIPYHQLLVGNAVCYLMSYCARSSYVDNSSSCDFSLNPIFTFQHTTVSMMGSQTLRSMPVHFSSVRYWSSWDRAKNCRQIHM